MNILLLGGGGREHALAWKIKASNNCDKLYISPGNAGTAQLGQNVSLKGFEEIESFCLDKKISMVVVGPEAPLVDGVVDFLSASEKTKNIHVIGPEKEGAQLEGSKDFAKAFLKKNNIPTASYQSFSSSELSNAIQYLKEQTPPFVLKADGLAAGKGVIIEEDINKAEKALREMLEGRKFGEASEKVVIESFMAGVELSVFVLTDGSDYLILPEAKDYKRIGEGDTGPNTGGMGAISPVVFADEEFMSKVEERVIIPTMKGLKDAGITYKGFIFIGLMNVEGDPYVVEYNCRLGDPEAEVVLPRVKNDLVSLFKHVSEGTLNQCTLEIEEKTAATTVVVSEGYPGAYPKGKKIKNLDKLENVLAFHAGTAMGENGKVLTNGGRVLAITALEPTISLAIEKSKNGADTVDFDGKYFRTDIGKDLLSLEFKS